MNSNTLESAAASAYDESPLANQETSAPSTEGQAAPEAPQMIGVQTEQAPTPSAFELAQGFDPTQVVCKIDGKDVTAAELKDYAMRQADYTRKTQEVAQQRSAQQEAIDFYENNRDYLQRLQAEDVNERKAVLQEIAKNFGVELAPKPRDEQGRFTSQVQQDELLYDLAQIEDPEQRDFAERFNRNVVEAREARNEVQQLKDIVSQLVNGVTTAQQQMQQTQEAEAIAADWKGRAGWTAPIDIQGALAYVAKGLPMEDAMILANKQAVFDFNARESQRVATVKPNEPGGQTARNSFSGAGLSFEQYANQTLTG